MLHNSGWGGEKRKSYCMVLIVYKSIQYTRQQQWVRDGGVAKRHYMIEQKCRRGIWPKESVSELMLGEETCFHLTINFINTRYERMRTSCHILFFSLNQHKYDLYTLFTHVGKIVHTQCVLHIIYNLYCIFKLVYF